MSTPEFWRAVEAVHVPVYFSAHAAAQYEQLGLKGFWMGYFASRSAALGTPSPQLVTAAFHGFAPTKVERALPDAWALASRQDILNARLTSAIATLEPLLVGRDLTSITKHLAEVVRRADFAGRPLAAAHAALPVPDEAVGALWHGCTVLREYHGDSHVAVLTGAGMNGATANALAEAVGLVPSGQRTSRGWDEKSWADAHEQLHMRGWVDEWRTVTEAGHSARSRIEDTTSRVANAGIGDREAMARAITATDSLVEIARAIEGSGAVAYPNPTGVPRP